MSKGGKGALARPYVYFVKADPSCSEHEVAQQRFRLGKELNSLANYMSNCDLEKPNEPVIVMFTRLPAAVMRTHLGASTSGQQAGGGSLPCSPKTPTNAQPAPWAKSPTAAAAAAGIVSLRHTDSLGASTAGFGAGAGPGPGSIALHGLAEDELRRVKELRRQVEEARDVANPRFVILCNIEASWDWTFVFLRSYARLKQGIHRLYPAAAQLMADRRLNPKPSLVVVDDLTPGPDTVARLRHKMSAALRPLFEWMGEEDMMEASDEVLPLYFTCTDVHQLAERFVQQAVPPSLEDLSDPDLQRMLLARDRLLEAHRSLRPRLLVMCNWTQPTQWVFVLCRAYTALLEGIGNACGDRAMYIWAQRQLLPVAADGRPVNDYCYSNNCPMRGLVQSVRHCPSCCTAKYCSTECQAQHWAAGHCRMCRRLGEGKLKERERPAWAVQPHQAGSTKSLRPSVSTDIIGQAYC